MKVKKVLCCLLSLVLFFSLAPAAVSAATGDIAGTISPTTLNTGGESATVYTVSYGAGNPVSGIDPYKTYYGLQYAVTPAQTGILAFDVTLKNGAPTYVDLVSFSTDKYDASKNFRYLSGKGDHLVAYFKADADVTYYLRIYSTFSRITDTSLSCAAYLFPNSDRALSNGLFAAGGYRSGGVYYRMDLAKTGAATVSAGTGDNLAMTLCDFAKSPLGSAITLSEAKGYSLSKTYSSLAAGTYYIKVIPDTSNTVATNRKYVYRIKYTQNIPVPITKIVLNKTSASVLKCKTLTLTAVVAPDNASNKKVSWTSSKTSVATVDANGTVKAKGTGACVITAAALDGSGRRAFCTVTVTQPVTKIKLSKTTLSLKKGKTGVLKATISPASAKNKAVVWSSGNKKIATVNAMGKITAKGKGSCVITCTAKDGSNVKATCKVKVK